MSRRVDFGDRVDLAPFHLRFFFFIQIAENRRRVFYELDILGTRRGLV